MARSPSRATAVVKKAKRVRTVIPAAQKERIHAKRANLTKDLAVARTEFLDQAVTISDQYDRYVTPICTTGL